MLLARRADPPASDAQTGLRFSHWPAVAGICLLGCLLMVGAIAVPIVLLDVLRLAPRITDAMFLGSLAVAYGLLLALVTYAARDRWAALAYVGLFLPFPILLILFAEPPARSARAGGQLHNIDFSGLAVAAFFFTTPAFIVLTLAALPARVLNRRFLFLLIGLGLLLGLNEISKLELWRHLKA